MDTDIKQEDSYYNLVKNVFSLIAEELTACQTEEKINDLSTIYPKLVVMYEFFRLLRGEAFIEHRRQYHSPMTLHQKEFYDMENQLKESLDILKGRLDPQDDRTNFNVKQMQKSFAWALSFLMVPAA